MVHLRVAIHTGQAGIGMNEIKNTADEFIFGINVQILRSFHRFRRTGPEHDSSILRQ